MNSTMKLAGAAVLALAFAAPAMAAPQHYGDTAKAPPYGISGPSPTAPRSKGGAGIQSYKGGREATQGHLPKNRGVQLGAGGAGAKTGASH